MAVVINGTTGITSVNGSASAPSVTGTDTDTGIVYGTNTLSLATGGTTAVTVDSSQNVGIGTSSPSSWGKFVSSGTSPQVVAAGSSGAGGQVSVFSDGATTLPLQIGQGYATASDGVAYISQQANQPLVLRTNATERMRIDASGNVGIGTSSPSYRLDVQGNGDVYAHVRNNTSGSGAARLLLTNNGDSGFAIINNSGASGVVNLLNYKAAPMAFWTDSTERMRIDTSGNLLVGTTSAFVLGRTNFRGSNSGQIGFQHTGQTGGKFWYMGVEASNDVFILYPGTTSGGVYMTYGATSWTGNSDERLKTPITPFVDPVAKVCSLRAGTGRFLTDEETVSRSFLIAQDVQAVLPEAVDVRDDEIGTLGLRYTDMIPLLTAAIQEQQAIIEQLRADVAQLKGQA